MTRQSFCHEAWGGSEKIPTVFSLEVLQWVSLKTRFVETCAYNVFIRVIWLIHVCDVTCEKLRTTARINTFCDMTWLIHMCDLFLRSMTCRNSLMHVTLRVCTCDMTTSYMQYDLFIHMTWHIHTRDMNRSYTWQESFVWATWNIRRCDMTHSDMHHTTHLNACHDVCKDSFIHVIWLKGSGNCEGNSSSSVTWLIHEGDMFTWALQSRKLLFRVDQQSYGSPSLLKVTLVFGCTRQS